MERSQIGSFPGSSKDVGSPPKGGNSRQIQKVVIGPDKIDNLEEFGKISYQSKHSLQRYGLRKRGAALFSKLLKNFHIFPFSRNRSANQRQLDSIVDGLDFRSSGVILVEKISLSVWNAAK